MSNSTLEAIDRLEPRLLRTGELAEQVAGAAANSDKIGLRLNASHLLPPVVLCAVMSVVAAAAAADALRGGDEKMNTPARVVAAIAAVCLVIIAVGLLRSSFDPRAAARRVTDPDVVERATRLEELEAGHGPDAAAAMLRILNSGWYRHLHGETDLSKALACLARVGGLQALAAAADVLTTGVLAKDAYDCHGAAYHAYERVIALKNAAELVAKRKGDVGEFVATAVAQGVPTAQLRLLATEVTAPREGKR